MDGILQAEIAEGLLIDSAEIRLVSADDASDIPTGDVLFSGELAPAIRTALGLWLDGDAPLLESLIGQVDLAQQHTQLMKDALDAGDHEGARQHAEHAINIIEGVDGDNFGDLDGNGRAENPGDDVGVQNYLADARVLIPDVEGDELLFLCGAVGAHA